MKNLANIITLSRIIGTLLIILFEPLSAAFFVLYFYCGVSDILDGYFARKKNSSSQFGSVLDSVADAFFFVIIVIRILPVVTIPKILLVWIILIAGIRVAAYIIGLVKYHSFSSLHTILNKLTGLLLFAAPVLYVVMGIHITGVILCGVATISSGEELLITIKAKRLQRDIKGIFEL